jgi:hypothetical protein
MDFNFITETITPDSTGMITIGGTQGIEIPAGTQLQRPSSPAAGTIRFTTATNFLEYWNGTTWYSITDASDTVTTVSGGTTGLTPATATTGAVTLGGTLNVANGGTGLATSPANGQLLIGNGTTYTLATITGGTGVTVTNAAGAITLSLTSSAYVSSISGGTTGLTPSSPTGGAVTLAGTLGVANGGTGLSSTPSNGQIDIGNGTGFVRSTLTAGNGISVASGAGSITVTASESSVGYVTVASSSVSQTTATLLPYTYNVINAGTGTAVILPTNPYVGQKCCIENRTTMGLSYYPGVGAQIENLGTNMAYTNAANGNTLFIAISSTEWYAFVSSYTNGPGISITATAQGNQYQFSNSGIISIAGTTNQITASTTSGATTLSLPSTVNLTNLNVSGQTTLSEAVVVAAGTTQGTATALTANFNIVTSGTGGVSLPAATSGGFLVSVENRSGATISMYPNSGSSIEGFGTNGGITLSNNASVMLISISATQWYIIEAPVVAGTNLVSSYANGIETLSLSATPSFTSLTLSGLTANSFLYSGTGGALTATAAPTNGQLLIGSTGAAPVAATITAGAGVTVTNAAGSITIAASGVLSDAGTANEILVNGVTTAQTGANVFTIAPNVILPGTASETIPSGTTAQRPATPTVAMMRYNTTEDVLEGYAQIGTGYTNIAALADLDNFVFQKTMNYRKRRTWYDDFLFGSAPSTTGNIKAFGDLGWSNYCSVTGINSIITGVTDHPGILSLGTSATASANMALYSNLPSAASGTTNGTIPFAQIEYFSFIIRLPSLTNLQTLNIGLVDNGALSFTDAYVNGVFFQYFYELGYWLPITYSAGNETYAPTTQITTVANTWYLLEMWNLGTSLVWAINGTVILHQTTNIPTTSILQPAVQIINNTAATSVTVQIDAFSMITQELGNRY